MPTTSSSSFLPIWSSDPHQSQPIKLPKVDRMISIGISVAIAGNVLISLALNVQKLAHKRLEAQRVQATRIRSIRSLNGSASGDASRRGAAGRVSEDGQEMSSDPGRRTRIETLDNVFGHSLSDSPSVTTIPAPETLPLLANHRSPPRTYSEAAGSSRTLTPDSPRLPRRTLLSRWVSYLSPSNPSESALLPIHVVTEAAILDGRHIAKKNALQEASPTDEDSRESDYLRSKLWWFGFLLMNLGEVGNFISYAFAPASIVAPLGTFALMANCIFAPLMLGERFRRRDLVGGLIAIIGAITVVLSSEIHNVRLDPDALFHAISKRVFIIYSCVYVAGAIVLAFLSEGRLGRRYVFVDVGLCALFGGFTVLATKGLSTLLTMEWINMFKEWIIYPTVLVLLLTGVGQIKYLQRALMRFDSKVVIPIQFVFFNLSAIVGSAILYGDFEKATFHQFVTFVYGCLATFAGVFIIASDGNGVEKAPAEVEVDTEAEARVDDAARVGGGSIRRKRPTIALPRDTPILRHRHSTVGLMGLSPAQHLLLVHTPPREPPDFQDRELDVGGEAGTPNSIRRTRAISWMGDDMAGRPRVAAALGGRGSRDSSLAERRNAWGEIH